jgi:hypothetical protein
MFRGLGAGISGADLGADPGTEEEEAVRVLTRELTQGIEEVEGKRKVMEGCLRQQK